MLCNSHTWSRVGQEWASLHVTWGVCLSGWSHFLQLSPVTILLSYFLKGLSWRKSLFLQCQYSTEACLPFPICRSLIVCLCDVHAVLPKNTPHFLEGLSQSSCLYKLYLGKSAGCTWFSFHIPLFLWLEAWAHSMGCSIGLLLLNFIEVSGLSGVVEVFTAERCI